MAPHLGEAIEAPECSPSTPEVSPGLQDFMQEDGQEICFDAQEDILRAEEDELGAQEVSKANNENLEISEEAQRYLNILSPFEGINASEYLSGAILEAEQEAPGITFELCGEAFIKAEQNPEIIESYLRTAKDEEDCFAQLDAFSIFCSKADIQAGNEEGDNKIQEIAEREHNKAKEELAALKSDPENQKMLALIESIKEIDPERYEELKTKGMKSEGEVFQKEAGNSQLSMKRLEKEENAGAATLERIALETQLQNAEKLLKNGEAMKGLLEDLAMREG